MNQPSNPRWADRAGAPEPTVLEGAGADRFDTAVARGAAYYGLVRRGRGVRIRGGTARSYYIGVEAARPAVPGIPAPLMAVCVAPSGMEEGTEAELPGREFALALGRRASFRLFSSRTRRGDAPGTVLESWSPEELSESSPVEVQLEPAAADGEEAGRAVPVVLRSRVTEVGTLELYFQGRREDQRWRLEFQVREPARGGAG